MEDLCSGKVHSMSLLPSLPDIKYVEEPERIQRFMVLLYLDGRIVFQGSQAEIRRFKDECLAQGLALDVENVSFCG